MATLVGSLFTSLSLESSSFVSGLQRSTRSAETSGRSIEKSLNQARFAAQSFIGVISVRAAAGFVAGLASMSDAIRSTEAQLKLAARGGNDFIMMQQSATKAASDFGRSYADMAKLEGNVAKTVLAMGRGMADVDKVTRSVAASVKISNVSAENASNGLTQFNQAMRGGIMRAEEFNSVVENIPALAEAIAKGMGMSMGELRAAMLDGTVTTDKLVDALIKVGAENEKMAASIPPRWDQAWTRTLDITRTAVARFDEGGEFSTTLLGFTDRAADGMADIGTAAIEAGRDVRAGIETAIEIFAPLTNAIQGALNIMNQLSGSAGGIGAHLRGTLKDVDNITTLWRAPQSWGVGLNAALNGGSFNAARQGFMDETSLSRTVPATFARNRAAIETRQTDAQRASWISGLMNTPLAPPKWTPPPGKKPKAAKTPKAAKAKDPGETLAVFRAEIAAVEEAKANAIKSGAVFDLGDILGSGWADASRPLDEVQGNLVELSETAKQTAADMIDEYARIRDAAAEDMAEPFAEFAHRAAMDFNNIGEAWRGLLSDMKSRLIREFISDPIFEALKGVFAGMGSGSNGGFFGTIAAGIGSLVSGGGKASGGKVKAGVAYTVGERGHETFIPGSDGYIKPNGGGLTINVDASRSTNPAETRRQVTEGIMEAMPMIRADAADYTIGRITYPTM